MILDVFYGGQRINDYCIINEVLPNIPPEGEKQEVEIKFTIKHDVQFNLDEMTKILYSDEPKALEISDRPDRYLVCKLEGGLETTSRFRGAQGTLHFVSEDEYWISHDAPTNYSSSDGYLTVENEGTAPSSPRFEFDFKSEAGFLSLVAPDGNITVGNMAEVDRVNLPEKQRAINLDMKQSEEVTQTNENLSWYRDTAPSNKLLNFDQEMIQRFPGDPKTYTVYEYKGLNLGGMKPEVDSYGYKARGSFTTKARNDAWNAWARLIRPLDWKKAGGTDDTTGEVDGRIDSQNWRLDIDLDMWDSSGNTRSNSMFKITVFDYKLAPIISTSIYNAGASNNQVTMTARANRDPKSMVYADDIVHSQTWENGFGGKIRMQKAGNNFLWSWHDTKRGYTGRGASGRTFRDDYSVRDAIYIRNTARYGYHYNGSRHTILSFTRGRQYRITRIRMVGGRRQYEIAYRGIVVYWMYGQDLTYNPRGLALDGYDPNRPAGNPVRQYRMNNATLGRRGGAYYVHVMGGSWGTRERGFTHASINTMYLDRHFGEGAFLDVKNFFQPKDKLVVDHATGLVTINGLPAQGEVDVDGRFFKVPTGATEFRYITNDWATFPDARVTIDKRFR